MLNWASRRIESRKENPMQQQIKILSTLVFILDACLNKNSREVNRLMRILATQAWTDKDDVATVKAGLENLLEHNYQAKPVLDDDAEFLADAFSR